MRTRAEPSEFASANRVSLFCLTISADFDMNENEETMGTNGIEFRSLEWVRIAPQMNADTTDCTVMNHNEIDRTTMNHNEIHDTTSNRTGIDFPQWE